MFAIESIDLSGLNYFISSLRAALFGTGQDGDLHRLLKTEAGQLAWEISEQLGPKSKSGAEKGIDNDLKTFLTTKPRYSNLDEEQQESSYSGFTWLAAGPNFLLGINDEDNRKDASADEALQFYYAGRKQGGRGKAYVELGTRGAKGKRQHIQRLNRTRISTAAYNSVRAVIKAGIGQMKASFASTAARLIPTKRIPSWVREQINAVEMNGKSVFDDTGLSHPTSPFIRFGSRAKGVQSNPYVVMKINNAATRRTYILADKIKKVLSGYTYDWNNGRTFRQTRIEDQ